MVIKPQTIIPIGVVITKCPPRRAQGLKKQEMRARGGTRLPVNKRPVKEPQMSELVMTLKSLPNK